MGMRSSLSGGTRRVKGELRVAVFKNTCSQWNCRSRLRTSAPGNNPASVST